jgi:ribosomal protein L21E
MRNMDKIAEKISTVMGEYKDKSLHSGKGGKVVKSRKQAIAIALSEANKVKGK